MAQLYRQKYNNNKTYVYPEIIWYKWSGYSKIRKKDIVLYTSNRERLRFGKGTNGVTGFSGTRHSIGHVGGGVGEGDGEVGEGGGEVGDGVGEVCGGDVGF